MLRSFCVARARRVTEPGAPRGARSASSRARGSRVRRRNRQGGGQPGRRGRRDRRETTEGHGVGSREDRDRQVDESRDLVRQDGDGVNRRRCHRVGRLPLAPATAADGSVTRPLARLGTRPWRPPARQQQHVAPIEAVAAQLRAAWRSGACLHGIPHRAPRQSPAGTSSSVRARRFAPARSSPFARA